MGLFYKKESTLAINQNEHICIYGDYNDFQFEYHIYSEAFEKWIKQDMGELKKFDDSYQKLVAKIEKYLLKIGSDEVAI